MKQREWVLTVTITGPDEESVTAEFGYDSVDKLTGFPDPTGTSIIRNLAKMLIESTTPLPLSDFDEAAYHAAIAEAEAELIAAQAPRKDAPQPDTLPDAFDPTGQTCCQCGRTATNSVLYLPGSIQYYCADCGVTIAAEGATNG